MEKVRCLPDDREVDVAEGQTLLAALHGAGVPLEHACGGRARCTTCRVRLDAGADAAKPRTAAESALAEQLGFEPEIRLACQTQIDGPVTVRRLVLDERDVELTSRLHADSTGAIGRDVDATILFADVADFTPLSERLPAYDVVHLLNRYFLQVGGVIERHGGSIDNYMGDGLLAVFTGADRALRAVRASLEMHDEAADLSRYTQAAYGSPFAIRVGLHDGEIVVGEMGACHNRRQTVIGDVVNVASRIEAANKTAGTAVLVSEAVHELVAGEVEFGKTVELPLKGKSSLHRLHEIVALTL